MPVIRSSIPSKAVIITIGNEARLVVRLQHTTNRKAIHERHHHIQENQIRRFSATFSKASCPLLALIVS